MRVPCATYRVQLNRDFDFRAARDLLPYLRELGISDLYASPVFAARRGSAHGYDVVDPQRLNPELGGEQAFESLCATLRELGMGLLLDIVPNHMAASVENPWWAEVLESGPAAPRARVFDLFDSAEAAAGGAVLLPILGAPFGEALEAGELQVVLDDDGFALRYHERRLPLDPRSWAQILVLRREESERALAADTGAASAFRSLMQALRRVPAREAPPAKQMPRPELCRGIRDAFRRALAAHPLLREQLEHSLRALNGRAPASRRALEALLDSQAYRLMHWRLADERVSYRRFFDIDELVCVRVEDPEVFALTHALALRLAREGKLTGLRIDHVDGLYDPAGYLERLCAELPGGRAGFYVVVEKILCGDETLPAGWACAGTTGYEFARALDRLLVEPRGVARLKQIYARFAADPRPFAERVPQANLEVLRASLGADLARLASELALLAARDRHGRDVPASAFTTALLHVTAALPVYRTYAGDSAPDAAHRGRIQAVLAAARASAPAEAAPGLDFLGRVLRLEPGASQPGPPPEDWSRFVRRWQQLSGPAMAKGLEDTALYRYHALLSLADVGSEPDADPRELTLEAFHAHNLRQRRGWPHGLLATSTHDSKRSEDVRARLAALSEMPAAWQRALARWSRLNRALRRDLAGAPVPRRKQEVFVYQTLLGVWPADATQISGLCARLEDYLVKAAKEAEERTSWTDPHARYERMLRQFVRALLDRRRSAAFLEDFLRLQARVARAGALNSLAQVALKIASPGVPDFYQGSELWNLTLVDPDNRRPVDFARRVRMLRELSAAAPQERRDLCLRSLREWRDGRVKLLVTWSGLALRHRRIELFQRGDYLPLRARGPLAGSVCAFARRLRGEWVICVASVRAARRLSPRLPRVPARAWGATALELPAGAPDLWRCAISGALARAGRRGRLLPLREVLAILPVALLEPERPERGCR